LFQDPTSNPNGAQLLFTTHDTNLLGTVLGDAPLRRDQVWFTEKDSGGATHLYPLTDFHPRKHENLERGYLQGRYGAIPFVGELTVDDGPAAAPQDVDKREEDTDGLQAPQ
jgi:AAA15 family ATPase/GTPase